MKKLRFLGYMACFAMLLTLVLAASTKADAENNTTYTLDEDGTLTVYCEGVCNGVPLNEAEWEKVTTIVFAEGVTEIGERAFSNSYYYDYAEWEYTEVVFSEGLEKIGQNAFSYVRKLTEVHFPSTLTQIESEAFCGTGLTEVTLPEGLTGIAGGAFQYCPLTTVTIPGSVHAIAHYAFANTNLTKVSISEGVSEIGDRAFNACKQLSKVHLPASLTKIGDCAFLDCSADLRFTLSAENESFCIVDGVLFSGDKTVLYRYPADKTDTVYTVPKGVTRIKAGAFCGCTALTELHLPEGLEVLEGRLFEGCDNLTRITLPASLHTLEQTTRGIYYCGPFYDSSIVEFTVLGRETCLIGKAEQNSFVEDTTVYCYPYSATDVAVRFYEMDNIHLVYFEEDHEHTWTEKILKDPTCTAYGETQRTCTVCNYAYVQPVAKVSHTWSKPQWHKVGTSKVYVSCRCVVCDAYTEPKELDIKHEHKWEDIVVSPPTCARRGEKHRVCLICYKVVTQSIPSTAHKDGEPIVVAASCKNIGEIYVYCTLCSRRKNLEWTPALATHAFGELQVLEPASCLEEGKGQRECVDCGLVQEEVLPIAGHTCDTWIEALAPALFTTGREEGVCTVCGETVVRSVPKLTFIQFITPYVYILDALLVVILLALLLRKKKS